MKKVHEHESAWMVPKRRLRHVNGPVKFNSAQCQIIFQIITSTLTDLIKFNRQVSHT